MKTNFKTTLSTFAAALLCFPITAIAQPTRITAPLGPGGTWNVYEYIPVTTTFWLAHQSATETTHEGVPGHLVSINSKDEDLAVRRAAEYGNFWLGLTDRPELGGTETGTLWDRAQWDGWRGDPNAIPEPLRMYADPTGWVWTSGEPYNYHAWVNGEPNNFGTGEGAAVKFGSAWIDYPIGAFGEGTANVPYIIEWNTHHATPDPNLIQLTPLFPSTPLPGIDGGPGFAGIQVFRNGLAIPNVEDTIQSIRTGELQNPNFGTAPTINYHDPGFGGGGLFPSGRLTFPGNTAADDDNFQVLIKGAIEVPAGQGGMWTFNVHADDGFAFRINGAEFTTAHGNGFIDFTDRATLTHPEPTGDANTRGVVNLLPGVYPFQFVMFELGGGAFCELSAAHGAHPTDVSTTQWQLVNSASSPLKFAVAVPPVITQYTPPDIVVAQGNTATWTVEATGSGPLRYQWQREGVDIPGATSSSYSIPSVQPGEHDGVYRVIVSNPAGTTATFSRTMAVSILPRASSLAGEIVGVREDGTPIYHVTETDPSPLHGFTGLATSTDLENWQIIPGTVSLGGGIEYTFTISPEIPAQFFRVQSAPAERSGYNVIIQGEVPPEIGPHGWIGFDLNGDGTNDKSVQADINGRYSISLDTTGVPNHGQIQFDFKSANGFVITPAVPFTVEDSPTPATGLVIPELTPGSATPGTCVGCTGCGSDGLSMFGPTVSPFAQHVRLADGAAEAEIFALHLSGISLGADLNLNFASGRSFPGAAGNNIAGLPGLFIQTTSPNSFTLWNQKNNPFYFLSPGDGVPFTSPSLAGAQAVENTAQQTIRLNTLNGPSYTFTKSLPNQAGHLLEASDPNGNVTRHRYNTQGNLIETVVDENGTERRWTFTYTDNPHLKTVTDHLGRTWEFAYDSSNRLVQITSPTSEYADIAPGVLVTDTTLSLETKPRRTTFAYTDPNFPNYLTSITDERGAVTRAITYDSQGRVSTQAINGHTTQYIYEPVANPVPLPKLEPGNILTRVIDPEGNVVDTEIVGPGQPGQYGVRRTVTWTESGKGNAPLRGGEPLYYEQRWLQDCNCLTPAAVTQPFSSLDASNLNFGADGIPQNWPHTGYTYNADRQVLAEVYTDGTESIRTEMTYQPNGYGVNNQFGRMLSRKEPRAFDTHPIYANTNLNFTHTYEYDERGNMTKHIAPTVTRGVVSTQAVVETWTYNTNGQVLTHTDPNGNITINTYHTGPATGGDINTKGNFFGYLASITRGATGSTDPAVNLTTSYFVNALGQITRTIDPNGFAYDTEYNNLGEVVRAVQPLVTLRNGQTASYETRQIYDGAGNVVMTRRSNVDYLGQLQPNAFIDHSMSYDAGNHLLAERREVDANDANDLITTYAYDKNDQLIAVQKPEGNRVFSVYDERRRLLKQFSGVAPGTGILSGYPADKQATDLGGTSFVAMTRVDYDSRGNSVTNYDGRGYPIVRGFDFRNRQIFEADQNRNGWMRYYDDAGNVLATEQGAMPGANGVLSQVLARSYGRFDELGRQYQAVQDINPATSELSAVDPAGADNSSFLTRFDPGSRTVASFDANGNVTTFAYDGANRRTTLTDALSNSVTMIYDPNSNVTEIQETELPGPGSSGPPQNFFTTNIYDTLNRRIATYDLGFNRTINHGSAISYDSRGNVVLVVDAEGKAALNTYDDQNRLVMMQRFSRNPTSVGAQELQRSEFRYDGNSRKTNDIAYSDVSRLATSAQMTRYEWENADRQTLSVYPDSEDADDVVRTAYDASGNPVWVRDQRGVTFTNVFDPGNRLTDQFISLPPSVPGTTRQRFGYDALNLLTNAANNYAQVGRAYDALSRQTAEIQSIRLDGSGFVNGWEQPVGVACGFDKQSNNGGCTVTEGTNTDLTVTRAFDALNRMDTISAAYFKTNRAIADYNYYGPGRIQSKTLGNGARMVASYDVKRRIGAMVWVDPLNLLAGFEYGYDRVDNVLFEKFLHDGSRYDHFGYNDRYELTHVEYRSTNAVPPTIWRDMFNYDDNYNRKTVAFGGPFDTTNTVTDTYGANRVNEYTNIIRNAQPFTVQHDRAGNMTQFPVRPASVDLTNDVPATARWDAFNLLFDIENPATGKQHYRYDPFRRRIAALDSETSLQDSRRFICEGWSDIEERVFDPGATLANAPSTLERIYVEGPRIDEHLLAAIDRDGDGQLGGANLKNQRDITADQEYFFLQNRLGSTMVLSDADKPSRILEYVGYSAYGEPTVLSSIDNNSDGMEDTPLDLGDNAAVDPRGFSEEFSNPYLFTGRRFDDPTGLSYFRKRYGALRIGRFNSRDPLGYISGLNVYHYVRNSPTNGRDPMGEDPVTVGAGTIVIGGAIAGGITTFYEWWIRGERTKELWDRLAKLLALKRGLCPGSDSFIAIELEERWLRQKLAELGSDAAAAAGEATLPGATDLGPSPGRL